MRKMIPAIAAAAFLAVCIPSGACTTAVISARASATGRPMLWKQRDSGVKFNYVDFFHATDSTFAFTGVVNTADDTRESVWSGANTEGFAIMNSMSYGLSPISAEDRPWEGIIMKRALEICRTVDDFEAYVKSLPQPNGLEANFGVIDAEGGAAYFEVHDLGYARFDADSTECGYLVRSNYSMTGREGEGKGYDRYDIASAKMAAHGGAFSAEWIIDALGRDNVISRKTTISSTVIEGVRQGDPLDSSVLWCVPGYTQGAFAIPSWVSAGDLVAEPLRSPSGRGSALGELSQKLLDRYFRRRYIDDADGSTRCYFDKGCRRVQAKTRAAEEEEFAAGRALDGLVRSGAASRDDYAAFNERTAAVFGEFRASFQNIL